MMIGMNLAVDPVGWIETSSFERNQNRFLFAVENLDRYPAGRSMAAPARRIPAPDQSAARDIVQIDEGLTLEEALAHEAYGIFDDRLIFGMPRPCRVGQKASVVGVLQKRSVESWRAGIRPIQACFHSVDHDAPWTTAKELECVFEAIDDGNQILEEDGNHTAQPAVARHHHETVNNTAVANSQFLQQTKLSEVDFDKFSRCGLDASDCPGRFAKTTMLADKTVQRRIRHCQPLASEQFVDFR